jgi:hypothetical protein
VKNVGGDRIRNDDIKMGAEVNIIGRVERKNWHI